MRFVLISGPPASGKTTIAGIISKEFSLPLFSKDALKEVLFETMGTKHTENASLLGKMSFGLVFHALEQQLKVKCPCVIEGNFRPSLDRSKFLQLQKSYASDWLEIFCHATQETLLKRFEARSSTPERHPGHADIVDLELLKKDLAAEVYAPLNLQGSLLTIETTNFENVSMQDLLSATRKILSSSSPL